MKKAISPYKAHLFVCTKTRDNDRKSCGDNRGLKLAKSLKDEVKRRGLKPAVRVSTSGCLGLCEDGPNIMIYPQGIWFSAVTQDDLPEILGILEKIKAEEAV